MTEEEWKAEIERRDEIINSSSALIKALQDDLDLEIQKGKLRLCVWENEFFRIMGVGSRKTP